MQGVRHHGRHRQGHLGSGLELLLNIVAMLLVLVALVYLANAILGLLPEIGGAKISLQRMLGYVMAPVCWLMGLPWPQAVTAGSLMGTKTVLNELIAYVDLSKLAADALDPRSRLIMLYAMCGFANFGSLGIMIGGLGTMAPTRRDEINSLGAEVDRLGHADDLPDGRDRGGVDVAKPKASSLRAKRSNPYRRTRRHGSLRRFAPRNDDAAPAAPYAVNSFVSKSAGRITSSNSTSSE